MPSNAASTPHTAVMAHHHEVFDAQLVHRVLDGGQAVQVGRHHHVGHVAVHKHLAWLQAGDLVGRHPAVGATDPHVLGLLLRQQAGEEAGRSRSIWAAQARLWTNRSSMEVGMAGCALALSNGGSAPGASARSAGFSKQLAADQHAPDLAGARPNLVQLGIAPEAAQRVLVDVAVATDRSARLRPPSRWPSRHTRG